MKTSVKLFSLSLSFSVFLTIQNIMQRDHASIQITFSFFSREKLREDVSLRVHASAQG